MLIAKNDLGNSISLALEKWFQRTENHKTVGVKEHNLYEIWESFLNLIKEEKVKL